MALLNQDRGLVPQHRVLATNPSLPWMAAVETQFRDRDPSLFFVLPRVVRRVLRHELEISSPWVRVPHRKSVVMSRDRLLWLVAADELGVENTALVPDRVILIARPEEDQLASLSPTALLQYYWRLVFHARIDAVMQERLSPRLAAPAQLRQRIDRLGQEQFDEVRSVLKHEGFLTHPDDPRNVYAELVSVYAELDAFAPTLVPLYFPSLPDRATMRSLIHEDCDTDRLLETTCPPDLTGQALRSVLPASTSPTPAGEVSDPLPTVPRQVTVASSKWRFRWLTRAADRYRDRGNMMRSAVLRQQARSCAPLLSAAENEERLRQDLDDFACRLQNALELDDVQTARWRSITATLLDDAVEGYWNANARLLYDLQKVCVDHERDLYRVDLARWLWTWGRSPLRRPLPDLKPVLITKHLRSATRRVSQVRIPDASRSELRDLLHQTTDRAEDLLRRMLQPQVSQTLLDAGLVPCNVVEQAAFTKLTEELIDGIVERGFLTLGHLRDAVSRGHLKLADLQSPRQFLQGDTLLQADRQMAATLDGVYQRGPFYLRWLQRLTSVFFGTPLGRLVTLYLALPFGGSFVILKGLQFLVEEVNLFLNGDEHHSAPAHHIHIYNHTAMLVLGLLLVALINSSHVRQAAWLIARSAWLLIRGLVVDLPRWVYRLPGVAWLLRSLPVMILRRYVISPVAVTLLYWKGFPTIGLYDPPGVWSTLGVLAASAVLLNSRVGRDSEELFWEWLGRIWHRFRVTIVIGLFNLIVDVFRQIMDALERVLYGVDEWLRFRTGESQFTLALKAVLGLVWGFVQGIVRFCVTLLIEPQLNPIKHFPVVTVSHKLLLPLAFQFGVPFEAITDRITARAIGTTIVSCIPGVFGFLAWELKENWRVYAANRSSTLRPVLVGHHGETLLALLKPGFHSGTIPKLFARRRRAARKARGHRDTSRQTRFEERLHHEAIAVQHFVDREFVELLRQSRRLGHLSLTVQHIELSTNRITACIAEQGGDDPLILVFAEQSGWLVAGIAQAGWTRRLSHDERIVLSTALAGLYHFAAVDLVREQIEHHLGSPPHPYDISETGLIVWPTRSYDIEILYPLDERPMIAPRPRSLARTAHLEPLAAARLIFREHPLRWDDWRNFWDAEKNAESCPTALLPHVVLLRE